MTGHLERVAKEVAEQFEFECTGADDHDYENCEKCLRLRKRMAEIVAAALAACAREAKLEQAEESEQALLAARKFVRGRHSVLTFGPRALLERLDVALLQITKLRLEVTGERAVGEKGQ